MIHTVSSLEKKINDSIRQLSFDDSPQTLYDPIRYILSLGGKRVRPLLTLMSANLFGGNVKQAIPPAVGIEIFHNFSLLHDDLMDRADMRRGRETVHRKWNDNAAILSGDAMLIEAYKYVADVPAEILPEVLSLFTQTAMEVCRGQQFDIDFETRMDVTETEYIEMIRLKTAVLIAASLKMGAIIAKAPAADADLLYKFGINIGLAFQLKDDLLDVYGDPKIFGKKTGGDILCNKKTFLLIKAFEKSDEIRRKELDKWITAQKFDPDTKINAVKNIYDDLKLNHISQNLIEKYYLAALDCLSGIHVSDERKKELFTLTENLMYREK